VCGCVAAHGVWVCRGPSNQLQYFLLSLADLHARFGFDGQARLVLPHAQRGVCMSVMSVSETERERERPPCARRHRDGRVCVCEHQSALLPSFSPTHQHTHTHTHCGSPQALRDAVRTAQVRSDRACLALCQRLERHLDNVAAKGDGGVGGSSGAGPERRLWVRALDDVILRSAEPAEAPLGMRLALRAADALGSSERALAQVQSAARWVCVCMCEYVGVSG
jgi:hypothetical protein